MIVLFLSNSGCDEKVNNTAIEEQAQTEKNQTILNDNQPAPRVTWSLERYNLTLRALLMNDRSVTMYMYVFIEGVGMPIGYYIVNKVSSVNSQLTNPMQVVQNSGYQGGQYSEIPSPAEDGSYGSNGDAIFGFTPDGLYIEHNMKYIVATAPMPFSNVPMIGKVTVEVSKKLKKQLVDQLKSMTEGEPQSQQN
jgi:hypothetical protein